MIQFFFISMALLFVTGIGQAHISNFRVNGDTTAFTVTSGDVITWEYDIDSGGTAYGALWIDLNQNGEVDLQTDLNLFGYFTQTDGDPEGNNGPPDMDGQVNGHIYLSMPLGLAPAHYILGFTDFIDTVYLPGIVTPLASPAFSISGAITPPLGIEMKNIAIQAEDEGKGTFWLALTDTAGNYSMEFDSSAISTPWRLRVVNNFPPAICTPRETTITTATSVTGVNFIFVSPSSKIAGYLKNESGDPIPNASVYANRQNGGDSRETTTDTTGFYQIGFTDDELLADSVWRVEASWKTLIPTYFPPSRNNIIVHPGDSVQVNLTALTVDDSITGRVTVEGNPPQNTIFYIYASAGDSGNTVASSDPTTGEFTLYVLKRFSQYYIGVANENMPAGYGYENNVGTVHAGDDNLILRIAKVAWVRQNQNSSISTDLNAVQFINDSTGWVVGNGVVLATTDSGKVWNVQLNTSSNYTAVFFVNPSTGWVLQDNTLLKTTNGGGLWEAQTLPSPQVLNSLYFSSPTEGWIGCNNSVLFHTTDGTNWQQVNLGVGSDNKKILFTSPTMGWTCGYTILNTTDGGSQWNQVNIPNLCYVSDMQFVDMTHGWLLSIGCWNSIVKTNDGGQTWTFHVIDSMNGISAFHFIDTLNGWAVGNGGKMYSTADGGEHWYPRTSGIMNTFNDVQFVNASLGWAVGYDGTILRTTVGGKYTDVREDGPLDIPNQFSLGQNYPNPFNPSTTFSFTIGQPSFVTLRVYNLLGQEVASLINEDMHQGKYTVTWNPTDLPSGMYFYRLTAGKFVETKKLLLMR